MKGRIDEDQVGANALAGQSREQLTRIAARQVHPIGGLQSIDDGLQGGEGARIGLGQPDRGGAP